MLSMTNPTNQSFDINYDMMNILSSPDNENDSNTTIRESQRINVSKANVSKASHALSRG